MLPSEGKTPGIAPETAAPQALSWGPLLLQTLHTQPPTLPVPRQQEKALSLYFLRQCGLCWLDSPATEPGSWSPEDKPKNKGLEEKPLNILLALVSLRDFV